VAEEPSSESTGAGDKKDTPAQKKQVKNEHVLIIVGVVTLVVMVIYMRKSASNSQSSGSQSVAASPYGVTNAGSSQDPYGYGSEINTLANDLQSMQSEIVGLAPPTPNSGSTTPAPFVPPTGEIIQGGGFAPAGYSSAPITDATGATYDYLQTAQQEAEAAGSHTPLFYQPTPGVFQPFQPSPGDNTPVYIKAS
jgi:hypothetical protein